MESRLEEAEIFHSYGNITASIQLSKLVIRSIHEFQRKVNQQLRDKDLDTLLVETYLQCGHWLVNNQIDSASIILTEYLLPASKLADRNTKYQRDLVAESNFTLVDFASNVFDSQQ